MSDWPDALTLQFLDWVASQPRSYSDAMDAWRTNCPKMPVWEDAISAGLVIVENGDGQARRPSMVVLTLRGRTLLDGET